jgi:hypothetical protein
MNYIPKRNDTPTRALYAILLAFSVIAMTVSQNEIIGVILRSVAIVALSVALYLFIRYDMTTYTYTLSQRNNDFDFVINKSVGRRGNYVCYCYMSDCVFFEKCTADTKKELRKKYTKIGFYNFSQNIIKREDYVIVFKNESGYDAVFFEPNDVFAAMIADAKANAKKRTDKEEDESDEPDSTNAAGNTNAPSDE